MADEVEKTETPVESKPQATAAAPKPPEAADPPNKAALVLAFKEVFNASVILASLITSDDSRGSTNSRTAFTSASCK